MKQIGIVTALAGWWILCPPAPGQAAGELLNRAPAGVEAGLRARVTQFYGLHVQSRFRQSEAMVCEESKDAFYNGDKNPWSSQEILKVIFEDEYKSAKVLTSLGWSMKTPSGSIPSKYPITSFWKLREDGWCFYLPPMSKEGVPSPFGMMHKDNGTYEMPVAGSAAPAMPSKEQIAAILDAVKISRTDVRLKGYTESSDEIVIANGLRGAVQLEVRAPAMPGLTFTLGKKDLPQGEKTTLRVHYLPPAKDYKPPITIELVVEPLNRQIPIQLTFEIADEEKKKLPAGLIK